MRGGASPPLRFGRVVTDHSDLCWAQMTLRSGKMTATSAASCAFNKTGGAHSEKQTGISYGILAPSSYYPREKAAPHQPSHAGTSEPVIAEPSTPRRPSMARWAHSMRPRFEDQTFVELPGLVLIDLVIGGLFCFVLTSSP